MNAFKSQQHRWAKGSIQTCRKLLPRILRAKVPLGVKVEAFFHLTANFNYILMCILSLLIFPSMVIRYNMGWYEMLLIDVPLFFAATFSFCNFYLVCQREIHHDWLARAKYVPFLMSVGIGLSINNARAVVEALFNRESEFTRTPKYRIEANADEWIGKKYPSVGRGPAAHRARIRVVFHLDRVLRARQRDLRHAAVSAPVHGGLSLHGPPVRWCSNAPATMPSPSTLRWRAANRPDSLWTARPRSPRRGSKTPSRPRPPSVTSTATTACWPTADTTSTTSRSRRHSRRSATSSGTGASRRGPSSAICNRRWWRRGRCRSR